MMRTSFEVNRVVMLGHAADLNTTMRSVNGNGKRRLLFSHQNMMGGSLTKNKDKRTEINLTIAMKRPDVFGISETELGENTLGICNIDGYNWETKFDSPRISVLVNNSLDYKRRTDLEVNGFSAIWLEVSPRNKNSVLICQVYREWKRKNPDGTWEEGSQLEPAQQARWAMFMEVVKKVAASNQEFHLLGDVNLDRRRWRQVVEDSEDEEDEGYASEGDDDRPARLRRLQPGLQVMVDQLFEDILNVHNVSQLQTKISYIRVDTKNNRITKSCLDLYFTNRVGKISEIRAEKVNTSDHHMISGYRRTKDKMPLPSVVRKRKWSKIDWPQFNKQMRESNVETWILNYEDAHECAKLLTAAIRVHLDIQQQVKTYQLRRQYCSWVDESTKKIIEMKRILFEIWKRTGTAEDWAKYRKQSNYLVRVLRQKKTDYMKAQLRSTMQSKDVFKAARQQLGFTNSGPPSALTVKGELVTNPGKMAEAQNGFFVTKVDGIAKQIPKTKVDPLAYTKKFLKDKQVPGFDFQYRVVSEYEVGRVIDNLKNTTSCGHDDINVVAVKQMKDSILTSLTYIINLSLRTGEFPDIWKLAKVIPLWKNNGDKTEQKCYRPIALLPVLSKILEKFVSKWLNSYLEVNNLWSDRQHGYRRHRSTATALLQLQEEILKKHEEGSDVAMLCFDSSAAFDTLTHSILLEKLALYGCSEHVIKWFTSYLSNRWQYCEIGGKASSKERITQGVFQGSVLGPLLYILYVNCISVLQDSYTKLTLYADDTNAAVRLTKNHYENRVRISVKAAEMQMYMDSHSLKFNSDKTQLIVKLKGTNNTHGYLNLKMGDKIIEQENTVKVLGVLIGQDEKYKEYLVNAKNSMLKFLNTRHSMLKMLSKFADLKTRKALAEGLILSKVNYCICLWGTTNAGIMKQIEVVINDVVRTVFGIGRRRFQELTPLYKKLKWLRLTETLQYHDVISLHNVIKYHTPEDLADKFTPVTRHSYNTRSSSQIYQRNPETISRNTLRSGAYVCRAARHYEVLDDMLKRSLYLPRWAFKDVYRSRIGGWPTKERTSNVLFYLEDLKAAGKTY